MSNTTVVSIKEELKSILADFMNLDGSKISDKTDLFEDLGVDSTQIIEILLELEEHFDVEFDVEELDPANLENLSNLSKYIYDLKEL